MWLVWRYVSERNAVHRHDPVVEGQLVFHGTSRKVRAVTVKVAEHFSPAMVPVEELGSSVAIAAQRVAVDSLALLAAPVAFTGTTADAHEPARANESHAVIMVSPTSQSGTAGEASRGT